MRWMFVWLLAAGALPAAGTRSRSPAPHVRIEPLAAFDSLYLVGANSWSPNGARLLMGRGPSEVWIFDATRPKSSPRRLYDAGQWIRSCDWSPDGSWLLMVVGDPNATNERSLLAVPLDGTAPDTMRTGDIRRAFWGPDGLVYFRTQAEWLELPPPPRWKPTAPVRPRPTRAFEPDSGIAIRLGPPDPKTAYELVCLGTFRQGERSVNLLDALPDGSRLLVDVYRDTSGFLGVVDGEGRTVVDLRKSGIRLAPTALSSDGRLVVGYSGNWKGEGYERTWLEAADALGRWSTKIVGGDGGGWPQMSREGTFIAFRDSRRLRVGRLTVEGPAHE